ncbi:hypothetical protein [Kitasatospora sp. NPDC101183]|uniref:hypothetical protein n=1 Tax=Kitasatospora sp. NPDC101183 TaxID=3364100 RepID=UPI00381E6798
MQTVTASSALACKALESRRFAELAARTGLEPDLERRYAEDPVSVLAEFGLSAAEPLYVGDCLTGESVIMIEELDPRGDHSLVLRDICICLTAND